MKALYAREQSPEGRWLPVNFEKLRYLVFAIVFSSVEAAYTNNSHDCCDEGSSCC